MYRAEIISNQSVQDDIVELLETEIEGIEYTILPAVQGRGVNSKKLGYTVWPEQNFVLFTFVEKEAAQIIKQIITALKQKFPREGISLFFTEVAAL